MGFHFEILYASEDCVVIDKPEGFHVHAPEAQDIRVDPAKLVLQQLRNQLGTRVFPVHRLDAPTSGCLLMALSPQAASSLGTSLQAGHFQKTYTAVVRGWAAPELDIQIPLESEDKSKLLEAHSKLRTLATHEIFEPVGKRHPTARYSLLELEPVTGRFHQLRRHLNRINHPVIGDVMHGDRHHNHFFAQKLGIAGLCLRAHALKFPSSENSQELVAVSASWPSKWNQILELFRDSSNR